MCLADSASLAAGVCPLGSVTSPPSVPPLLGMVAASSVARIGTVFSPGVLFGASNTFVTNYLYLNSLRPSTWRGVWFFTWTLNDGVVWSGDQ